MIKDELFNGSLQELEKFPESNLDDTKKGEMLAIKSVADCHSANQVIIYEKHGKDDKDHGKKYALSKELDNKSEKGQEMLDEEVNKAFKYIKQRWSIRNTHKNDKQLKSKIFKSRSKYEEIYDRFCCGYVGLCILIKTPFSDLGQENEIKEWLKEDIKRDACFPVFTGSVGEVCADWAKLAMKKKKEACKKNEIAILIIIVRRVTLMYDCEKSDLQEGFQNSCNEVFKENIYPKMVYYISEMPKLCIEWKKEQ